MYVPGVFLMVDVLVATAKNMQRLHEFAAASSIAITCWSQLIKGEKCQHVSVLIFLSLGQVLPGARKCVHNFQEPPSLNRTPP